MPVYNVEKYLSACLNSICSQTYPHFELIAVNDGSSDKSLEILNEYARNDKRIKVINSVNQGVSAARNLALDQINNDYVLMFDSDDLLQKNSLELLVNIINKTQADIVCFDYQKLYRHTEVKEIIESHINTKKISKLNFFRSVFDRSEKSVRYLGGYVWVRAVKSNLLKKCRFDLNLKCYEDEDFFAKLYLTLPENTNIVLTDAKLYLYRKRLTSLINTDRAIRLKMLYKFQRKVMNYFQKSTAEYSLMDDCRFNTLAKLVQHHLSLHKKSCYRLFKKIAWQRKDKLPLKNLLPFLLGYYIAVKYSVRRTRKAQEAKNLKTHWE